MTTKKYDLAVKVGEYQKNGETKGRYENIGSVMVNDDGGEFILIKRTFNPAGVPNPQGKDSVIVSKFEVKDKDDDHAPARAPQAAPQQPVTVNSSLNDEIPF